LNLLNNRTQLKYKKILTIETKKRMNTQETKETEEPPETEYTLQVKRGPNERTKTIIIKHKGEIIKTFITRKQTRTQQSRLYRITGKIEKQLKEKGIVEIPILLKSERDIQRILSDNSTRNPKQTISYILNKKNQ
jgi:hypothetical protein